MKKNIIRLLLLCILFLTLTGCHGKEEKKQDTGATQYLYYLNHKENGLVRIDTEISFKKDHIEAAKQVLDLMSSPGKKGDKEYSSVMNEQIKINAVTEPEDGQLSIDFGPSYLQMDNMQEILFRAAVVRSLVQIDGLDQIVFTVKDEPLTKEDGTAVGRMNENTFVLDSDKQNVYDTIQTVSVYYADSTGKSLVEKEIDLQAKDNEPIELAIINALKKPVDHDLISPIPESLIVNRINVTQKICYVDFNEDIEQINENVEEEIKFYAIVNSLTSLENISQVQITVNGEAKSKINGFSGLDFPLAYEYSYVLE